MNLLQQAQTQIDILESFKDGTYDYTDDSQFIDSYNNLLNECNPCENINDYAQYLEESDDVAYRTGMDDYWDSYQNDGRYKELDEYSDALDELIGLFDQITGEY